MHTGNELAAAIREAIAKKMEKNHLSRDDIAKHFGIKTPSIYDWEKKGSVDKAKLPELWRYFADVADMAHWGLKAEDFACFNLAPKTIVAMQDRRAYGKHGELMALAEKLNAEGNARLLGYASSLIEQFPAQANPVNSSSSLHSGPAGG